MSDDNLVEANKDQGSCTRVLRSASFETSLLIQNRDSGSSETDNGERKRRVASRKSTPSRKGREVASRAMCETTNKDGQKRVGSSGEAGRERLGDSFEPLEAEYMEEGIGLEEHSKPEKVTRLGYMAAPSRDSYIHVSNDTTTHDYALHSRPTEHTRLEQISCEEMFRYLVDEHKLKDVSSELDRGRFSFALAADGGISDIWRGTLGGGTEVAIKVWRFSTIQQVDTKSLKRAMREIYYWSKIDHENVQKLIGVTMFDGRLGMVSQWMEHGDLRQYMIDHPKVDRYSLCYQVATGVEHLHSQNMVHGDLKAESVFMSRDNIAKLGGFARLVTMELVGNLSFSKIAGVEKGSTRWMAPELVPPIDGHISQHSDVYALGMTMLEIITGSVPYPQLEREVDIMEAKLNKRLPDRPMEYFGNNPRDDQMWELLMGAWSDEPTARPNAAEIVSSVRRIVCPSDEERGVPTIRGIKRHLKKEQEYTNGDQVETTKRGKVVHPDYTDTLSTVLNSPSSDTIDLFHGKFLIGVPLKSSGGDNSQSYGSTALPNHRGSAPTRPAPPLPGLAPFPRIREPSPASSGNPRGAHEYPLIPQSPPWNLPLRLTPVSPNSQFNTGSREIIRWQVHQDEWEHERDDEEQRGKPERDKIIHSDYADVFSNHVESPSSMDHLVGDTAWDAEMVDFAGDARFTVKVQSEQLSCEEMFECLVAHGCADLTLVMDPEQYSKGLIQGGAFGDIWKGKLFDGTEVAIKVWRFSSLIANDPKSLKRAMREIYHWSKVKHEYVQELMGVVMFQGRLGMVSRWMDNGNLREYIHKNPSADRYVLCMQVATGIAHLHSLEMLHGDLKAANILVSSGGVTKISDFDHSIMSECSLAFSDTSKPGGGTTRWMAPELILDDNCSRSAYTDVYALGMTMLEIITGISPYYPQCRDDVNVIKAIMKKTLPTRPMEHLSDNSRDNRMWELLLSCWSHDPRARPTAAQVVKSLEVILALPTTSSSI